MVGGAWPHGLYYKSMTRQRKGVLDQFAAMNDLQAKAGVI